MSINYNIKIKILKKLLFIYNIIILREKNVIIINIIFILKN